MIKSISIYLGSKCNMNCAYCHREAAEKENGVTDKLLALIKEKNPREIRFFGGEPTLYMDDIKRIVEVAPNADFTITTNGMAIAEHIPYLKSHDFKVIVSYDGDNKNLRGGTPFKNVIGYPKLGVSTTLYHGNTDLEAILGKLVEAEKIVGKPLSLYPHLLHHTSEANKQFALTERDVDELAETYHHALFKLLSLYSQYGVINKRYAPLFAQLMREYESGYKVGETYCVGQDRLKVNANGEAFNCLYIRNVPAGQSKQFILRKFPRCAACKLYSMCGAACVQSLSHDIECRFYKKVYSFFSDLIKRTPKGKIEELRRALRC